LRILHCYPSLRLRPEHCGKRSLTEPLDRSLCHEIDFKKGQEPLLLTGMRVVSFCHYLQGPAAMQYLADMGADVIKIEPPQGAFERHWAGADGAAVGGVSALYLCANRNVRSIAIDLKRPGAAETVLRLVASSHVLAENFRPGTLDRLGIGYEAVRGRKPDVIYASSSGFGADGPYAARPGQDLIVQAMSGLVSIGGGSGAPAPAGCTVVDQHGAALFALAIVAAYAKWLSTGQGTRIEATLLGAAIDLQMESIVTYFASASGRSAFNRDPHLATWFHPAPYGIYRIKDCFVALSLNEVGRLAAALNNAAVAAVAERNPFLCRDEIAQVVARELLDWSYEDLAAAFDRQGIWYSRVDDYEALKDNPQARHNGHLSDVSINGQLATLVNHPVRYDGELPEYKHFAMTPGADSRAVLGGAGFSETEIGDLIRDKIVFAPD
jgi:crotonobetainyl-CoA:carnitine CoA-transferase CaiB-like acyl-CoA transferase